jgi:hypothetical protein
MTRTVRAGLAASLLLALVGLGTLGVVAQQRRALREQAWQQPPDAAWQLRPADGSTPDRLVPQERAGLPLQAGDELRFLEEDGPFMRFESFSATVELEDGAGFELSLRGDAVRLVVPPGAAVVRLVRPGDAQPPREAPLPPRQAGEPLVLRVQLREQGLVVDAAGGRLLQGPPLAGQPGHMALRAVDGCLRVQRLAGAAHRTEQDGDWKPHRLQAMWLVPDAAELAASDRRVLLGVLVGLLVVLAWLRALCLRRPPLGAWLAGGLLLLAAGLAGAWPAALSSLLPAWRSPEELAAQWWNSTALVGPGVLLLVLALPLALRWLRPHVRTAAPLGRLDAWRAAAVAALLAGATGWIVARDSLQRILPLRAREQLVASLPAPAAFARKEPLVLDLANALVVPGMWRDGELTARVTLTPGSVLGLRVRAPDPGLARGMLLLLSADPRLASGWRREDTLLFEPQGEAGGVLTADRPLQLRVLMHGRALEALVDGAPLARAEDERFALGAMVLLVQRGEASLAGLSVVPQASEPLPLPSARRELVALLPQALVPAVALLVFAAAGAWLLRRPWPSLLEPAAFACVPFLLGLAFWRDADLLPANVLRWTGLLAVGLLFLVVVLRTPAGQAGRGCLLLLLALAGVPLALHAGVPDEAVLSDVRQYSARYADWSGERLEEDLLYFTHPRFRQSNLWLAQHRLRSGTHSLHKPPGTRRVLTLGGSATWGFRLPPEQHLEWPALIASQLGPDVELLNGSFVGAPGFVLLRSFRDVLLHYEPDVLVLSLYHADAAMLSQADEQGYYAEITAPGFRRSWLSDARVLADLRPSRERYERLVTYLPTHPGALAEAWTGHVGEAFPPARYAAMLRQFAALCVEHHVRLVLVLEPMAGDAPGVWKEEFYAAMRSVAADCGAPCVDPRPALQAAGGDRLCFDRVHLNDEGHAVVAREVLPAVQAALQHSRTK